MSVYDFYKMYAGQLRFVNSINKIPKLARTGWSGWEKDSLPNHYKSSYFTPPHTKSANDYGYGLVCGEQLDGSYLIVFDFDIYDRSSNNLRKPLQQLFDHLTKNNFDGVFESSTIGNHQMLIQINDAKHIEFINSITNVKNMDMLSKFECKSEKYSGLEFLLRSHTVLPPSQTMCKKTKKLRTRKFKSQQFIRIMDEQLLNVLKDAYHGYLSNHHMRSKQIVTKHKHKEIQVFDTNETTITPLEDYEINKIKKLVKSLIFNSLMIMMHGEN